ncbi:hypothetical protein SAMN04487891_111135 [Flagellimonas taeanensis]|uniref:Lipoprotein n=1 Tax=Flagellimonas taeanensis TaxID=1005926 RepID=A0A1M6W653_9FLAO|nr:hypothetical protein [Allomuricauda taeanensis]SFC46012.1 hypothetical protein SAMN04487891_111135 [Allomuricauda taeanensis]SHK89128.1 hypothetical protein SAMN05216293_2174 [Allomuricauda taeanensis]
MSKILSIILFGLILLSCKGQSERIENDLYKCLINSLSEGEKIKLTQIFDDYEKHLIEKGILKSSDSKDYYYLYKRIADSEVYDFANEFNFSEKISFLNRKSPEESEVIIGCHRKIFESKKYRESNLYKFTVEIKLQSNHMVTPVVIAKTTIKYMTEEDFELEYNRFNTLMFIENFK